MPVLESTDNVTPRSVLRHRPIGEDKNQLVKRPPVVTSAHTPIVQRASRPRSHPADTEESEDITEWQRTDEDEESQDKQAAPPRRASVQPKKLPATPRPKTMGRKRRALPLARAHPLLY